MRRAFAEKGADAISIDLKPAEDNGEQHIVGDVREIMTPDFVRGFDLLIGFPDCTFLCGSGLHWIKQNPERLDDTLAALDHFNWLLWQPIDRICLENPVGFLSRAVRPPDQYIQPYQFGHDASKNTGLWLVGLPPLPIPPEADWCPPRYVGGLPRWGNQTDSGQNKLAPSENRAADRARFYSGWAKAMVDAWYF